MAIFGYQWQECQQGGQAQSAERHAWLPVFAIVLSGLWLAFRRVERG